MKNRERHYTQCVRKNGGVLIIQSIEGIIARLLVAIGAAAESSRRRECLKEFRFFIIFLHLPLTTHCVEDVGRAIINMRASL